METEQHPWIGKGIYLDFGDGIDGGETRGKVIEVAPNGFDVTVDIGIGEPVTEDIRQAIYIDVEDFGVVDIPD